MTTNKCIWLFSLSNNVFNASLFLVVVVYVLRMGTLSPSSWRTDPSTWGCGWAWPRSEWRQRLSTSTWDWRLWSTVSPSPTPRLWCLALSCVKVSGKFKNTRISAGISAECRATFFLATSVTCKVMIILRWDFICVIIVCWCWVG